jgi:hypothetical protein
VPFRLPFPLLADASSAARSTAAARIAATLVAATLLGVPLRTADAQRRPGVGMGFYTYTGLVSAEIEAGQMSSSTARVEAPTVALSATVSAPIKKLRSSAWIVAARGTALTFGNSDGCLPGCQQRRFTERAALLTGAAIDIRSTVLRVLAGPVLHSVEETGSRVGTQIRLDYGSPRVRGATPILFLTRSFMGSQGGREAGITTIGASFRFVRKR